MLRWTKQFAQYIRSSRKRMSVLFLALVATAWAGVAALSSEDAETKTLTYRELATALEEGKVESIKVHVGQFIEGWWSADSLAEVETAAVSSAEDPHASAVSVERPVADFRVTYPTTQMEPILARADSSGVGIDFAEPAGRSQAFWANLLPQLLLIGFLVWFLMRTAGNNATKDVGTASTSTVTFSQVAGADGAVEELREIVDFLKKAGSFEKVGARPIKGALLHGPPGTGKTLLARAVAGEAGVPFYSLSGSEVTGFLVGLGAHRIRGLFKKARKTGGVIFIDEIDALGGKRGRNSSHNEDDRTLNQLLVEMDGFHPRETVVVIAATNRPEMLDPALKRPGRLDRMIPVGLPDVRGRAEILKVHVQARQVPLAADVDLEQLARLMPGNSGADLANLVNESAIHAGREEEPQVHWRHFEAARDRVILGKERKGFKAPEREWKVVAYHEAGHALAGVVCCPEDGLHKVTIQPRGQAMGVAHFAPDDDINLHARDHLCGMIQKGIAGRAAEEIIFGAQVVTSGAKSDLIQVNRIAREMVYHLGMGEHTGLLVHDADSIPLAGETQAAMDREVQSILAGLYSQTLTILEHNREALTALAEALLERETLTGAEAIRVMEEAGLDRSVHARGRAA